MSSRVLVVDDDPRGVKPVVSILTGRGYEVRTTRDAESVMASIRARWPALVITDLDLPSVDGIELCHMITEISNVPVIVMSAATEWGAEVAALDAGAADYVVKPFVADLLLARVRVALRRSAEMPGTAALGVGEFHIDFDDRRVRLNGQPVRLTPKEFDLLTFMARHPNRVLPHKTLLGAVWGQGSVEQSEYLRVFVGQLRKKLESDPSNPRYLVTEPWVGYRFNPTGLMQ